MAPRRRPRHGLGDGNDDRAVALRSALDRTQQSGPAASTERVDRQDVELRTAPTIGEAVRDNGRMDSASHG
jgi:hypothetical protein